MIACEWDHPSSEWARGWGPYNKRRLFIVVAHPLAHSDGGCYHSLTGYPPSSQGFQIGASQTGWGGILLALTNNLEEKFCRYCSGTFNEYQKSLSSTNLEIEAIILVLEKFQLFLNQEQFTLRTDCENITKFFKIIYQKMDKISERFNCL